MMKTVKLFWKEAQIAQQLPLLDVVKPSQPCTTSVKPGFFWKKIHPVQIDTDRLVHLFETKSVNKDTLTKVQRNMLLKFLSLVPTYVHLFFSN